MLQENRINSPNLLFDDDILFPPPSNYRHLWSWIIFFVIQWCRHSQQRWNRDRIKVWDSCGSTNTNASLPMTEKGPWHHCWDYSVGCLLGVFLHLGTTHSTLSRYVCAIMIDVADFCMMILFCRCIAVIVRSNRSGMVDVCDNNDPKCKTRQHSSLSDWWLILPFFSCFPRPQPILTCSCIVWLADARKHTELNILTKKHTHILWMGPPHLLLVPRSQKQKH